MTSSGSSGAWPVTSAKRSMIAGNGSAEVGGAVIHMSICRWVVDDQLVALSVAENSPSPGAFQSRP